MKIQTGYVENMYLTTISEYSDSNHYDRDSWQQIWQERGDFSISYIYESFSSLNNAILRCVCWPFGKCLPATAFEDFSWQVCFSSEQTANGHPNPQANTQKLISGVSK